MERFDHLEAGARAVLEAAAVVGRRFPLGPLAEIAGIEAPTEELLAALETADLVFRSDEDGGYEFRNALIRDAVYDSLLGPRKAELHGRAAAAFERLHANRLEEAADLLTHHYSLTDQADKAMRYLAMAGEKSLGVYALEEAAERIRAVLDLFERHPDADDDDFLADVLLGVARVHYFTIDFGSLIAMVEKYLPRIEALGDQRRLSRFLFETGYAHVFGARQDIGRPLLERALEIGQEIDDEVAIAYTKMGLMWHYIYWEPASVARRETVNRLGEEAIEVGLRIGDVWLTSKAMVARGNEAAMWGRPDEAVVFDLQLLELSRETGDPRPRGMGLWRLAYLTVISGDPQQGVEHADEALNLSMSPIDRLYARGAKAFAMVLMGRAGEALEILEEMRRITAAGNLLIVNFITVDLPYGLALVIAGRMAEGVAHIEAKTRAFEQLGQPLAQIWSGDVPPNVEKCEIGIV